MKSGSSFGYFLSKHQGVYDMSNITKENIISSEFVVNTGTESPVSSIRNGEKTDLLVLQGNTAARSAKVGSSEAPSPSE